MPRKNILMPTATDRLFGGGGGGDGMDWVENRDGE